MAQAYVHINGVTYEYDGVVDGAYARQLAERLGTTDGGYQVIPVRIEGKALELRVQLSAVWASGAVVVEPPRSAYEDHGLQVV